jgi:hypothetical protein
MTRAFLRNNVFMGFTPESMFQQLTAKKQTLALLTQADWELLQANPVQLAAVKELYKVKLDLQRRVVCWCENKLRRSLCR